MTRYILTPEQAHGLVCAAGEAQAVGWCDVHGAVYNAGKRGAEISAVCEGDRWDIKTGEMFCMLHGDAAYAYLTANGIKPEVSP